MKRTEEKGSGNEGGKNRLQVVISNRPTNLGSTYYSATLTHLMWVGQKVSAQGRGEEKKNVSMGDGRYYFEHLVCLKSCLPN